MNRLNLDGWQVTAAVIGLAVLLICLPHLN